jgi:hypothetical protein
MKKHTLRELVEKTPWISGFWIEMITPYASAGMVWQPWNEVVDDLYGDIEMDELPDEIYAEDGKPINYISDDWPCDPEPKYYSERILY